MPYPDTFGWDTVFAISKDRVNIALSQVPASPPYSATTPVTGGTSTANWTFTNWRITDTPGGDMMEVTIDFGPGSQLTSTSPNGPSPLVNLDDPQWSCVVTFRAHFDATDPQTHQLRAITAGGASWAQVEVQPGGPNPNFHDISTLQQIIVDWFNSSEEAVLLFRQEFASVDIGSDVGSGPRAWLKPTRLGYAGATMEDGVTKAMGILAMTTSKNPIPSMLQLSPYAILPNAAAGYVVSRELVMRHMILPACQSSFSQDGVGVAGDFALSGDDFSVLKNTHALQFPQECDGDQRTATLAPAALTVTLDGAQLRFQMTPMNVPTSHVGLSLNVTIDEHLTMAMLDKDGGAPGEKFFALTAVEPIQDPKVETVKSTGLAIAQVVVAAIVVAITAVLAVKGFKGPLARKMGLSATSAKTWARILAVGFGLVGTAVVTGPEWMKEIINGQTHHIPEFGPVLTTALGGISWPGIGATPFHAVSGQFANGMLITIDPQF